MVPVFSQLVSALHVNRNPHGLTTYMFGAAGSILKQTGSIGLALIYWTIGAIMAIAGFGTYLELASYFPSRSGSEVVYLEQAYPRPKYFFPVAFAVQTVVLSFSSSNAIVLSRYVWRIANKVPTDWEMKGVAIAAYTAAVICTTQPSFFFLFLFFFPYPLTRVRRRRCTQQVLALGC